MKYFSVCLLLMSLMFSCKAQDSIVTQNGKQYKMVTVKAKQTLYSLSKEYKVSVDDIKTANNGLTEGLKTGNFVLIPLSDKEVKKVEKREAKKVETIKPENTIIKDSVALKLPESNTPLIPVKTKDSSCIKVAFVLPFQLAMMDSLQVQKKEFQDFQIPLEIQVFVDFYEGALLALDSLKRKGVKVKAYVYDDKADTNEVKKILNRKEMENMDIVIGPAHAACVKVAARICSAKKLYMLSAFSKNNDVVEESQYVIKTLPSKRSYLEGITKSVFKLYPSASVVVVSEGEGSKKNADIIQAIIAEKALSSANFSANPSKLAITIDELKLSLSKEKMNVVIIPSDNEAFVTRFLNSLYKLAADYKMVVYGMESWKKYEGVDIQHFQTLNVHLPSADLNRYNSPFIDNTIHSYVKRFKTEPSDFAFSGYDLTYLFVNAIQASNELWATSFLNKIHNGSMTDYYFVRKNPSSGIENTFVGIMIFKNYELVWLND